MATGAASDTITEHYGRALLATALAATIKNVTHLHNCQMDHGQQQAGRDCEELTLISAKSFAYKKNTATR